MPCASFQSAITYQSDHQVGQSVPIVDVPDAPLATVEVGVSGGDCLLTLGVSIVVPQ